MRVWHASLAFYALVFAICEALRRLVLFCINFTERRRAVEAAACKETRKKRRESSNATSTNAAEDGEKNVRHCGESSLQKKIYKKEEEEKEEKEFPNPDYLPWITAAAVNEFIGTLQVCAPMFDVNLVLANYGLSGVVVEIAFLELANTLLLRDAYADPCQLFIAWWEGELQLPPPHQKSSTSGTSHDSNHRTTPKNSGQPQRAKILLTAAALLAVEFVAGYAAYLLTLGFWSVGLHPAHLVALGEQCSTDLATTVLVGSAVEAAGLLAAKASEHYIALSQQRQQQRSSSGAASRLDSSSSEAFGPGADPALTLLPALASGLITVAGIHFTGMYANPIVAWACTHNCEGDAGHLAHFLVYWVAPLGAWMVARRVLTTTSPPPPLPHASESSGREKASEHAKHE